jgi:hypothetical protein
MLNRTIDKSAECGRVLSAECGRVRKSAECGRVRSVEECGVQLGLTIVPSNEPYGDFSTMLDR